MKNLKIHTKNFMVFILVVAMIVVMAGCQNDKGDNGSIDNTQISTGENNSEDNNTDNSANIDKNESSNEHDDEEKQFNGNMNDFSADTLDGGTFSNKDFENYDITMVNIWTTWCSFCVVEMSELQGLYEKLPENINMITVCADATTEEAVAKLIIEDNKCKFPVLIPDEKLEKSLLRYISSLPTTVFVDNKGNVIGSEHIGLPDSIGKIADGYLKIINKKLEMLNIIE